MTRLQHRTPKTQTLISEALEILAAVGIPVTTLTSRQTDMMAMSLLAVAGVTDSWGETKGHLDDRILKTRDVINYINQNFQENISSGSYDDIRRKHLKLLVVDDLVLNVSRNRDAPTNDPTRGYSLEPNFSSLPKTYKTRKWKSSLSSFLSSRTLLKDKLARKRKLEKVSAKLPNGRQIDFSLGEHNVLQKKILEEFLPRFAKAAQVLYVGDTANKFLHLDKSKLEELSFFELSHDELPDIVAYDEKKNWLFLIEAVYSTGIISEIRMLEMQKLTSNCKADIVYVTAFLSRVEFRKWAADIAWETEVWVAENPDHLIHFNGEKFLGPYDS